MTDWADEIAKQIHGGWPDVAAALRKARQDGELAGLMKAGEIATLEPDFHMKSEYQMGYEAGRNAAATAIYSEATGIRLKGRNWGHHDRRHENEPADKSRF